MMTTNKYAPLFLALLAVYSQFAIAEEPPAIIASSVDVSEEDYIGEVPAVLTVSRLSQSIADAPSAVTVIDRETIRAAGIADLPEIFRLVPGFYVAANAGFVHNTNHVVSYHGMATAYAGAMQVLINGRSVYSPLYGGVQWSELPIAIADIARIEITRGPNAASYGANSFFGVINIITLSPAEQSGASVSAMLGNGRHKAFARYADKVGDASYRITAGYRDDDGLDNRNDFKRTRLLNGQVDYRVDNKNNLEFEFGFASGQREEGGLQFDPYIFLPRTKGIENNFELIRWRHSISDNSDFSLQAFHSYDNSNDNVTSANLRPVVTDIFTPIIGPVAAAAAGASLLQDTVSINKDVTTERYDIEVQHTFTLSTTLRGVWGGSLRNDTVYAPHYLGSNKKDNFDLQRLFGHAEWRPFAAAVLNVGAMVEHNSFTGTDISPRASLNFKLNPNQTIRFGVSTAQRTPNYLENEFNQGVVIPRTAPNPPLLAQYFSDAHNLKPERIVSKEIAYLADFGQLTLDTRLYYDNIHDYIKSVVNSSFAVPGFIVVKNPRFFMNAGDVTINGFEAQAKWRMQDNTNLLLNYARVHISSDELQTAFNITKSMPRNTISALLTHRFNPQWDCSIAYYQTSAVAALGDGNDVGSAQRTDARVAYKFNAAHLKGEVSAVVENLFNEHYQEFADYNTLKRRARVNLRLDF